MFLKVSPFIYEQSTGTLSFAPEIHITLDNLPMDDMIVEKAQARTALSSMDRKVQNPKDLERFYTNQTQEGMNRDEFGFRADYLIITSEALAPSFETLRQWKSQKGLYACISTIEEIEECGYSGDLPLQIKQFIYDNYYYNSTKYVLLGGDETVVPVVMCPIGEQCGNDIPETAPSILFKSTPTDLFYACFQGTFNWDASGNTVRGELNDGIDMNPQVYLTRLPVSTGAEIAAFTNKLLSYETGVNNSICPNRILFAGSFANYYNGNKSDAHYLSEIIYKHYVKPYWNGDTYYLFDTGCQLPENDFYYISGTNFSSEIDRGYNIINEISHGDTIFMEFTNNNNYTLTHAGNQLNTPSSILVTIACEVNHFDNTTPSLCETLINNPNGGTVACFASTRSCFAGNPIDSTLHYSELYDAYFYANLFTGEPTDAPYSFGAVSAKADLIEESLNYYNEYRYSMYSFTPIGDPEMPIFTSTPCTFTNQNESNYVSANIIDPADDGFVSINTGVANCRAVMSSNGETLQVIDNVQNCSFQMPCDTCTFTILKHNYYPYSQTIILLGENEDDMMLDATTLSQHLISVSLTTVDQIGNKAIVLPKSGYWSIDVTNVMTGQQVVNATISSSRYI